MATPQPHLLDNVPRLRLLDGAPHPRQWLHHPTPTPREEMEEQRTSPQPKLRRLDRKNVKGLAKDATLSVVTLIAESYAQEDVAFTGDTVHRKGTMIPDNKVMAYPEIRIVAHEFAARL